MKNMLSLYPIRFILAGCALLIVGCILGALVQRHSDKVYREYEIRTLKVTHENEMHKEEKDSSYYKKQVDGLENSLTEKTHTITSLNATITTLKKSNGGLKGAIANKDKVILSLKQQIDAQTARGKNHGKIADKKVHHRKGGNSKRVCASRKGK